MQFEFIEVLCSRQGHHTGIVRTRRQFAEVNAVFLADEKLYSPNTSSRQGFCHSFRHTFGLLQVGCAHRSRLEALTIVAIFLHMSDGSAE